MSSEGPVLADLERLATIGEPGGPDLDEALRLFSGLRRSPDEHRAINGLLSRDARVRLPEPLLVAVASALVDRGEDATAACTLARSSSTPALMIRAELLARAGDLASALAMAERVLLRDVDWPGARERHARWREELGVGPPPQRIDTAETLVVGQMRTPFDIVREVARGGAGVVYEARDLELGRRVALKMYHHPQQDGAQLLHETRVAVALSGPGIVRVFDVDPDHGWLALEWAGLGALRSLLRTREVGALIPIARWAVPLARALSRVHAAGWVHHDVKPGNVLFSASNAPLLGDFGTARRVGEPSPPGSLGYLSPERLAGRSSDPRDDIYGFGRVLEDCLDALTVADGDRRVAASFRALATACIGPDKLRPGSGTELLERTVEASGDRAAGDRRD